MSNLPVYGVHVLATSAMDTSERQPRVIVAAKSRAAAVRAFNMVGLGLSGNFVANYGGITGNAVEIEVANTAPGTVFYARHGGPRDAEAYAALDLH